jgi:hypothetical protein
MQPATKPSGEIMKLVYAFILMVMTISVAQAAEAPAHVTNSKGVDDGFYLQQFTMYKVNCSNDGSINYLVDTVAKQCFISRAEHGIALFPCSDLARRPEWKPILT